MTLSFGDEGLKVLDSSDETHFAKSNTIESLDVTWQSRDVQAVENSFGMFARVRTFTLRMRSYVVSLELPDLSIARSAVSPHTPRQSQNLTQLSSQVARYFAANVTSSILQLVNQDLSVSTPLRSLIMTKVQLSARNLTANHS